MTSIVFYTQKKLKDASNLFLSTSYFTPYFYLFRFFKLCKPNINQSYGSYGHSSFYRKPQFNHRPPGYLVEGAYAPYGREQEAAANSQYPVSAATAFFFKIGLESKLY